MNLVRAFVAGFVSTLLFHQCVIGLFYVLGAIPRAPWSLAPVPPLNVPSVISLAFWGGVWGIALWYVIRGASGAAYWGRAVIVGANVPTAVHFSSWRR